MATGQLANANRITYKLQAISADKLLITKGFLKFWMETAQGTPFHFSYYYILLFFWPEWKPEGPLFSAEFVCLCDCLSLTGTSTLQRWPIFMKLGHKDHTLIYFGCDHNGPDRPQRYRATPFWKFQKILENHRIRTSKFWSIIFCIWVSCVL